MKHRPEWEKNLEQKIITPHVLDKDNKVKEKDKKSVSTKAIVAAMKTKVTKLPKKLTRKFLMKQDDWDDWRKSEFKQLDQYRAQNTLGLPTTLPKGAN